MSFFSNRVVRTLSLCAALASTAFAASTTTNPKVSVFPKARITQAIDVKKLDVLPNTHAARVDHLADGGRVAKSLPLQHLKLVLKSSDEQEFALQQLLDQQQDKTHGNYHQWMTPDTFGKTFGVEASDLEKVKNWLTSNHLTVDAVSKGTRVITFSGASGDIETAFHTEMHNYTLNGKSIISANSDVSIPHALSSVVVGPAKMDNIHPNAHYSGGRKIFFDHGKPVSSTPIAGGTSNYLDPYYGQLVGAKDLELIYNANPMYTAGMHGEGQTVSIIAETDTLIADTQIYRSIFGLPASTINVIHAGDDPGNQTAAGDDVESDIDLQMAGSLAYNAQVDFIVGGITFFGDGVNTAALYAADNNIGDVISMSYGLCEADDTTDIPLFGAVWEQAASQGQTVFVSSGDSGPDTCAGDTGTFDASYSVTGWGETPYNVSVGGTEFDEALAPTVQFWSPNQSLATGYENALAYPPEVPWNLSQFGDGLAPGYDDYGANAGSSGISAYYALPSWQVGPGVPTIDPQPPTGEGTISTRYYHLTAPAHRYIPDISANASNGYDSTAVCSEGACEVNPDGTIASVTAFGGTSVSSPLMASAQALINQANGGRQGNANYYYYRVAAVQPIAGCSSTTYLTTATSTCGFHDVVSGSDREPTSTSQNSASIGWNVTPSFDLVLGLGSPDIAQLSALWKTVNFNATSTAMTLTPTTTTTPTAHGSTFNLSVTVTPASGTAQPTGQVAITAETGTNTSTYITLVNGTYTTATFNSLPAGTYSVVAHYFGDGTYGGSTSAPVTVNVGTETPTIPFASYSISTSASLTATSTFTYGSSIYLQAGVNPPSGAGVPTGSVTFGITNTGTSTALPSLTEALEPTSSQDGNKIGTTTYTTDASLITGNATPEYLITPNYQELGPGTYSATAVYGGDTTFNTVTATPITFVVGQAASALTLTPTTGTDIAGTTPVVITASVATVAQTDNGLPPTGTVTFTDSVAGALGNGALTTSLGGAASVYSITTSALTATGAHTVTAVYSGDTNYATATKTTVLNVSTTATAPTLTLTTTTPLSGRVLDPFSFTATLPTGASTGKTTVGTMYFYDNGALLTSVALRANIWTANDAPTLAAGTHVITASYSGNATLALDAVTSNSVTVTVLKNQPTLQLSSGSNNSVTASANNTYSAQLLLSPGNYDPSTGVPFVAVPAPVGPISFTDTVNGGKATVLASAPLVYQGGLTGSYIATGSASAPLVPGYHVIEAKFPADANYVRATSNTATLGIGITTTNIVLTAPTGSSTWTVTATAVPVLAITATPTGTMTFYNGTAAIGQVNVVAGVASLSITPDTNQVLTAVYSGDSNFYTSTSNALATAGYTLSVSQPAFTITPTGFTTTVTVTGKTFGGYTGTGTLACINLPARTVCPTITAPAFTFNGTTNPTYALTFTTTNPTQSGLLWLPAGLLAMLLLFARKRMSAAGRNLVVLAILFCGMMAVTGCGNGASVPGSTTQTATMGLTSTGTTTTAQSASFTTTTSFTFTSD